MAAVRHFVRHNKVAYGAKHRYWLWRLRDVEAFVFCANTGRCGSTTLSHLLTAVPGAASYHEPAPRLCYMTYTHPQDPLRQEAMRRLMAADRQRYHREVFYTEKVRAIALLSAGHRVYVETNNMFVKTFAGLAAECFGDRLRVIHLRRDPVALASSLFELGKMPGIGGCDMITLLPDDPTNVIDLADVLQEPEFDNVFVRCLLYWYEVEARTCRFRATAVARGIPWTTLNTTDLGDQEAVARACEDLGLAVDRRRLDELSGSCLNTRAEYLAKHRRAEPKAGLPSAEQREAIHNALRTALEARYGEQFWLYES